MAVLALAAAAAACATSSAAAACRCAVAAADSRAQAAASRSAAAASLADAAFSFAAAASSLAAAASSLAAAAPPLAVLHLPSLIAGVPGLAPAPVDLDGVGGGGLSLPADPADAGLGPPAALEACPLHRASLAFQTGCGWTGALDVTRGAITHLHAPPAAVPTARAASHGGWGGGSGVFVAPGAAGGLVAVDVAGRASAAVVPTEGADAAGDDDDAPFLPAATHVPLPRSIHSHATCVAVSPASGEVVSGTGCGRVVAFWGAV